MRQQAAWALGAIGDSRATPGPRLCVEGSGVGRAPSGGVGAGRHRKVRSRDAQRPALCTAVLPENPAFSAACVLTLALGIGANTAIFSVVDAVLLRRAPFADMDRLVMVWETDRDTGTTREPASLPDYLDFKARARSLSQAAVLMADEMNLAPASGDPRRVPVLRVSHELLPMLGLQPVIGRQFTDADDGRARPAAC